MNCTLNKVSLQKANAVLQRHSSFRVHSKLVRAPRPARRLLVNASALSLHCGDTTLAFNIDSDKVQQLNQQVKDLLQTFAQKQKAERPQRWPALEFIMKGDSAKQEPSYLEVFCNPNAHGTAFEAKVLITLKTADGVKITTEGKLTAFKADLDNCAV